jgi:hypothetical protein
MTEKAQLDRKEVLCYVLKTDNVLSKLPIFTGYPKNDIFCFYNIKIKAAFFGGFI